MKRIVKYILTFIICCFVLTTPFYASAEPKEVTNETEDGVFKKIFSISFPTDYESIDFHFDFEDEQSHHIEITTPTGEIVEKDSDSLQVIVSIDDGAAGKYSIIITADKEMKVSMTAECFSAVINESPEDISVSTAFSGLKLYFEDGDLCVSWQDIKMGKVKISVYSPATMETLADETVSGTSYRLAIPENIEEVKVNIVWASEAHIDGAGTTYTLPVVRHVDAAVTFPEYEVTNDVKLPVKLSLNEALGVKAFNNGTEVYDDYLEAGDYDIDVPIDGINNTVQIYLYNIITLNASTYDFKIVRDLVGPKMQLNGQHGAEVVSTKTYTFSGYVEDADYIYVNNELKEFDSDGHFEFTYELNEGKNTFIVCSTDEAGNENVITFDVTYTLSKGVPAKKILLLLVPLIILILAVLVIIKKVKDKNKVSDSEESSEGVNDKNTSANRNINESGYDIDAEIKKFKKAKKNEYYRELIPFALVLAVIVIIFTRIIQIGYVPSASMEPNVEEDSIILFNKFAYRNKFPERGDIINFDYNKSQGIIDTKKIYYCKRVIGVSGDEIYFANGDVYINGELVIEDYLPDDVETNSSKEFVVPSGCVFVMGDNRENSNDCRNFNVSYIDMDCITGKYLGHLHLPFKLKIFDK